MLSRVVPVLVMGCLAGLVQLRRLVEKARINYPVLLGGPTEPENVCSTIKGVNRFLGYPTTILLGRDGQVQHVEVGVAAETKARTDWWRNRLEKRVIDLLGNTP
ncbi:MAG: hypothetical protein A2Y76_02460 [Planctomycetes bacterium RBG_13_60_9]|nr:MAG: hypothetical protein A2Y76_02460 [Planctomycetes bacterium RBG_13_60_9]